MIPFYSASIARKATVYIKDAILNRKKSRENVGRICLSRLLFTLGYVNTA